VRVYPDIKLGKFNPQQLTLEITLIERGGGIGKVPVFLNGKEIYEDALNTPNLERSITTSVGKAEVGIRLDLKNHPLIQPNADNLLEVRAFNQENWLISRPHTILFKAPALQKRGEGDAKDLKVEIDDSPPSLYILSIGVSEYVNTKINLKFSAKDAEDMAKALEISGRKLFELQEKNHVFVQLLSSKQTDALKKPTKANILKALADLSKKVKHQDILVVYLAGHGTNYGGQDGDFYYLTQEALSLKLDDPALRSEGAIASRELTEALKKIVARKQVLMIDACHSGKAVDNLMAKRDLEGNTTRALERMKDRTGLHIITGCTADAVSYEASQYGQGLLTYSLLSGIKGLALREDKYLDIINLFQFARDKVPQLAGSLGGIQEPKVFSPYGSESFDIGLLEAGDKAKIPLAQAKPIFLHSIFLDEDTYNDHLKFAKSMDEVLTEHSARGENASLIFVQAQEFPNAYRLGGIYKVTGNQVKLKFALHQGENTQAIKSMEISGEKNDLEALRDAVMREVKKWVGQ
jgi:Caspase domain